MFNGDTPPPSPAPEYYQTMASDKALYPQALAQMRSFVAQYPQDTAARIALGKMLTGVKRRAATGFCCWNRCPAAAARPMTAYDRRCYGWGRSPAMSVFTILVAAPSAG